MKKIYDYVKEGGCDLHLHTHYSDGADSVVSLIQKVMKAGLRCFAVTDHDCIDAIPEVLRLLSRLRELGFECPDFIPGIEISAGFGEENESMEIHILGYFPSGGYEELAAFINDQRRKRYERNLEMCRCLTKFGMPVTIEELTSEGQKSIGRLHAANILVRKGYISSVKEGFDTLFGYGRPCYIKRDKPSADEAVKAIRDAGGIAVIAHPYLYKWTGPGDGRVSDTLIRALSALKTTGVEGAEAFHGEASAEQQEETYAAALAAGLIPTAGSDYHGENKNGVKMYTGDSVFVEKETVFEAAAFIVDNGKFLVCEGDKASGFNSQVFFPGVELTADGKSDPVKVLEGYLRSIISSDLRAGAHCLTVYRRTSGRREVLTIYNTKRGNGDTYQQIKTGSVKTRYAGLRELVSCDMPALHAKTAIIAREMTLFTV